MTLMIDDVISELVDLTDAELDAYIRDRELDRRANEARLAAAIAVADARALNQADGHLSMKAYLKATVDWADGEVARFRQAARTIDAHAEIGDAWLDGRLGSSQVSALSKTWRRRHAAERFGEFVPLFVEQGEQLPLAEFEVVLRRFIALSEGEDPIPEREAIEARTATVADADGSLFLRASGGDALATAEFIEIMRRYEQAEFEKDLAARDAALAAGASPEPFRSGPQRRFDALLTMARSAAASDGVAPPSSPLVSVLVDERTMSWILAHSGLGAISDLGGDSIDPFTGLPLDAGDLDDLLGDPSTFLDRRMETTTGISLRPTDVLRALLSGEIRRVVLGATGRVVDMGRSRRVFTGAAREAAALLTVTCDHPGCDMPAAWCQIDHSTEWYEGGDTDQDNAAVECAPHNRDKHQTRRRTRRATNGRVYTFRPDGTIMLPVGCRPPRFDDADDEPDDAPSAADPDIDILEQIRARIRAEVLAAS